MGPLLDERTKQLIKLINPYKDDRILVVGTGVFPKIEYFLFKNYSCRQIVSGDINKKNIENGKKVLPEVTFIKLDAQERVPFENSVFDKVIFTEVLEHLKCEKIALTEIRRVLKKRGKLILSVPKRRWFNIFSPITHIQHKREYSEERISNILLKNKFKIEKVFVGGDYFDLLNLWVHLIFKHFFGILHIDSFFRKQTDRSFKKHKTKGGTDIIILCQSC